MAGSVTGAGHGRILWFIGIGAVASVTDIGLLYVFCEWIGMWYLSAAVLSYCCGIIVSYCLNKYLTFHDTDRHYVRQFTTFAAISASSLLVNVVIIWILVSLFTWNYMIAKLVATCCAVFWNYHGQSTITFNSSEVMEKESS